MLHVIIGIICTVIIILGLVEAVRIFTLIILNSKKYKGTLVIVPISGHNEEAEYILRSIAMKFKWEGLKNCKICCLDCVMDEETRKICDMLCKDYEFMQVYNIEEFEKIFNIKDEQN